MKELVAIVERGKGKNNYSCFCPEKVGKYHLAGYGKNSREAMDDIYVTIKEFKDMAAEEGGEFPDVKLRFIFDVGAFFDYYPLDVTATAKYIGVTPSVLRRYVAAIREPKADQLAKIKEGIQRLSEAFGSPALIDAPVKSYVGRMSE